MTIKIKPKNAIRTDTRNLKSYRRKVLDSGDIEFLKKASYLEMKKCNTLKLKQ